MVNAPKVSVVILNYNGLSDTIECLESLKRIDYPNYNVILVDNASKEDEANILRTQFGNYIDVIQNDRNYGASGGRNIGAKQALSQRAEYIMFLDNDTIVAPDFLHELVKAITADKKNGIAGPKIYFYDEREKPCYGGNFLNYWTGHLFSTKRGKIDTRKANDVVEVDWVSETSLVSRDVLLNVGTFDEKFFYGHEAHDLCIRTSRAGFKIVFVPQAKIWHKIATRLAYRNNKLLDYGRYAYLLPASRFALMEKHFTRVQLISASIFYIASWPKLFVEYIIFYRRRDMLKGFIKGFTDFFLRRL